MNVPVSQVVWSPCWRIIPSRFPPIPLFERVTDPADLGAVVALEGLTNDRLRDEIGEIQLVPPEDRVSGPGAGYVMAAFTHLNPAGSRFTDGVWGVYYTTWDLDTAIAETRFHRANFMRATNEAKTELDMRVLRADLNGNLHDVRGQQDTRPELYDPQAYGAAQDFARGLRDRGSDGIVYRSVRHDGGECAAVFRPRLISHCLQERHLCYVWDGDTISDVYEKRLHPPS